MEANIRYQLAISKGKKFTYVLKGFPDTTDNLFLKQHNITIKKKKPYENLIFCQAANREMSSYVHSFKISKKYSMRT